MRSTNIMVLTARKLIRSLISLQDILFINTFVVWEIEILHPAASLSCKLSRSSISAIYLWSNLLPVSCSHVTRFQFKREHILGLNISGDMSNTSESENNKRNTDPVSLKCCSYVISWGSGEGRGGWGRGLKVSIDVKQEKNVRHVIQKGLCY